MRTKIEALGLQAIEPLSERPFVATYEQYIEGTKDNVRITMRTGHTLTGFQHWASKYHILLKIENQKVLVYKHGIYSYQIEGQDEKVSEPRKTKAEQAEDEKAA